LGAVGEERCDDGRVAPGRVPGGGEQRQRSVLGNCTQPLQRRGAIDALTDGEPAATGAAGPDVLDAVDEQLIARLLGGLVRAACS